MKTIFCMLVCIVGLAPAFAQEIVQPDSLSGTYTFPTIYAKDSGYFSETLFERVENLAVYQYVKSRDIFDGRIFSYGDGSTIVCRNGDKNSYIKFYNDGSFVGIFIFDDKEKCSKTVNLIKNTASEKCPVFITLEAKGRKVIRVLQKCDISFEKSRK